MLYDSHIHSTMSVDSEIPIDEAISVAKQKRLGIVITDHMDWDFPIPYPDFRVNLDEFWKCYSQLRSEYVLLGIELGMTELSVEKNRTIIEENDFDYVLGSVHVLHNKEVDEELYAVIDEATVYREYLEMCEQMVSKVDIDSLAHIDYPLRTTANELKYEDYKEQFDKLFNTLVEKKVCLELNTSRLSWSEEVYSNMLNIYKAYQLAGGKYVTLGSDAHEISEVGIDFERARDLLKKANLLPVHFSKRNMVIDTI